MTIERNREPLYWLRLANPIPGGQLDALAFTDLAQAELHRIVATGRPAPVRSPNPSPRPRRRRAPRVALVAGLVSMTVAVAGYALVTRAPSKPQTVACFATADLRAATAVVGITAQGPVAACARVWDEGYFGDDDAPALRACVLESGAVGVFPQDEARDVCLVLGLAAVVAPVPTTGRAGGTRGGPEPDQAVVDPARFTAFRDAVLPRMVDQGCIAVGRAEAIVREELDRAGMRDWIVTQGTGFSDERPCASLQFLPEAATVELVPLPDETG